MRTIATSYLRRGAMLWLTMRLCVSGVALLGRENPLHLAPMTVVVLIVGSAGLMVVDIHRRNERMLIGNLGFTPWTVGCFALVPAILGEAAVRLATIAVS